MKDRIAKSRPAKYLRRHERRPNLLRIVLGVLAIGAASPLPALLAKAQTRAGSISELKGDAQLKRAAITLRASIGMQVEVRDQITTSSDGRMTLSLIDGSTVYLGESSTLLIDKDLVAAGSRSRSVLSLLRGRVRSLVSTALGGVFKYEVHTPNSIIAVAGTEFEVAYVEGRPCPEVHSCMRYTTVGVYDGVVTVSNLANPAARVMVTRGYETTDPCELPPTSPAPLGMEELGAPGYR